jgi:hypothetical protein
MKRLTLSLSILISILLTGCIFDTIENKHLIGSYFLVAVDTPQSMAIVYNEEKDNSGGAEVILPTIFEVEWNNKFIVAKQHPENTEETISDTYRKQIFDSLKKSNTQNMYILSDSLVKKKYSANKETGKFGGFISKSQNEITFYFLIDTRTKTQYATLYFTESELDSAKNKLNVGQLDNKKYFDYLDKR